MSIWKYTEMGTQANPSQVTPVSWNNTLRMVAEPQICKIFRFYKDCETSASEKRTKFGNVLKFKVFWKYGKFEHFSNRVIDQQIMCICKIFENLKSTEL
jgi:hypothetical protein